jgi:hypothetical protein
MQVRSAIQAGIKPVLIQPQSLCSPVFADPAFPSESTILQSFCCAAVNADSLMQLVHAEGGLAALSAGVVPGILSRASRIFGRLVYAGERLGLSSNVRVQDACWGGGFCSRCASVHQNEL